MKALEQNPAVEVRLPKMDAAKRLTVTDEDLVKLLEATERQRSDFRCVRDRAVLSIFIFCGLRRQELLDLAVEDLNLNDQSLTVQQGKGRKARTVYLCDEALGALHDWLALRNTMKCQHPWLFVTENRRRMGETSLYRVLEDVKAIAGLRGDPRIKPHSIRHAAATRLMRNGADIRSIQTWLGHAQLQTTAVYLHTDEQQARRIAPLAGFKSPELEGPPPPPPGRAADYRRRRRSG
jgi:site-specific recombinase XerD